MKGSPGTGGSQAALRTLIDLVNHLLPKHLFQIGLIPSFQYFRNGNHHLGRNMQVSPLRLCPKHQKQGWLPHQNPGFQCLQSPDMFLHIPIDIEEMEPDSPGIYRLVQIAVRPHEKSNVHGIQDTSRQKFRQHIACPTHLLPVGHQEYASVAGGTGTQSHRNAFQLGGKIPLPLCPDRKSLRLLPADSHRVQPIEMLHHKGLVYHRIGRELLHPSVKGRMLRHISQMPSQPPFLSAPQGFPVPKAAVFRQKISIV